ncbi:uncharacterized protein LOC103707453 [Phoenix dactylifera]|uniref:Uncharacterized protein LOC103707453 n=1 Tax=Phoenix dactylifera TaxID=42345 RepID=A0A8B7C2G2_PHODC|nr:uncharacterized protein LOC103707453 [Phoenix dactylifera]
MMRKGRRVPLVESSPSSSSYMAAGEEARARFKYLGLLQEYEELVKETEAKKKKLQRTKQKKLRLLAEVKFLRRKYGSLLKNPSQATLYRLKKQSRKMPSTSVCIYEQPNPIVGSEIPAKDRNHRVVEAAAPSTSTAIDLNQISLPNGEEMEEFQVGWEPLKLEKSKRSSTDGEGGANDLKLSICRDVGNNSNRVGKRKISWQDQVALRV